MNLSQRDPIATDVIGHKDDLCHRYNLSHSQYLPYLPSLPSVQLSRRRSGKYLQMGLNFELRNPAVLPYTGVPRFISIGANVILQEKFAIQAAYQAGRATVLHAIVGGLLATQRLNKEEVIAFFRTVRDVLEEEITNAGEILVMLRESGFDEEANRKAVDAFREAIELQLRLIEIELHDSCVPP